MKRLLRVAAVTASVLLVASCEDDSPFVPRTYTNFEGVLSGANVKPTAVTTTASGTVLVTVNSANQIAYNVGWFGLAGGNATAATAGIYGPADENSTGTLIVGFSAFAAAPVAPNTKAKRDTVTPTGAALPAFSASATSGGASGTLYGDTTHLTPTVTGDSLRKLLTSGLLYVSVPNATNVGGELRAQIKKSP